jgi:hypothetical protein
MLLYKKEEEDITNFISKQSRLHARYTSTVPHSKDKLLYKSTNIAYTEKNKTKREKNEKCPK